MNIVVLPVLFEDGDGGGRLASFTPFSEAQLTLLEQLSETLGVVLNTIVATMRTEELLQRSRGLTLELQSCPAAGAARRARADEPRARGAGTQPQGIRGTAAAAAGGAAADERRARGEGGAARRAERAHRAEERRGRGRAARSGGKDRAARALVEVQERVPREHEARAAHAAQLPAHPCGCSPRTRGTLTGKQVEFAKTIYNAGSDLLELINDILDLTRSRPGRWRSTRRSLAASISDFVDRTFRPVADGRAAAELMRRRPAATLVTDEQRLQQVLKNLLSNAFKFTASAASRCASHRPATGSRSR